LAAEIRSRFPKAMVDLVASGGGRFEVSCNGKAIFQKSRLGRHPERGEILKLLAPFDVAS
jgi:selT/selW/selH-like putative selenoprotein